MVMFPREEAREEALTRSREEVVTFALDDFFPFNGRGRLCASRSYLREDEIRKESPVLSMVTHSGYIYIADRDDAQGLFTSIHSQSYEIIKSESLELFSSLFSLF